MKQTTAKHDNALSNMASLVTQYNGKNKLPQILFY
jgi:hypothetical protein